LPPWSNQDAELAARFGIALRATASPETWVLRRIECGALELSSPATSGSLTISMDPQKAPLARRLSTARPDQPLPRAIGLHRRGPPYPALCDATAGLGRDALILAQLGCRVLALERVPALAALIADAAERTELPGEIRVRCADAVTALPALADQDLPDVVYLDPMFSRTGRAQVKKEMQVCRMLAGDPDSPLPLLHTALRSARDRVIVKRHPHLPPLLDAPSLTVSGQRVRFDVYLNPAQRLPAGQ